MRPLSIIYLYQNCGLYLRAACINYFSYYLRLVFEGGLYLKAASIRENTVCSSFWNMKGEGIKVTSPEQKFLQEAHLTRFNILTGSTTKLQANK